MTKLALIVGGAANVWEDVAQAKTLGIKFDATYCVKMAGIDWPDAFQVWATLHPEAMDDYEAQRAAKGLPVGYEIVAPPPAEFNFNEHSKKGRVARRVSYRWPGMTSSASSGIYGAKVALDDGFDAVLAGIPMQPQKGHFKPEAKNVKGNIRGPVWNEYESFVRGLEIATPFLKGRCVSLSGYTQELLGAPTPEWLAGRQH